MSVGELPATLHLGPKGEKVIPERFKDVIDCQTACNQMLDADAALNAWRTAVQRLHDGNPTYSLEALRESGQGWRARTNYRGLEGLCDNIGSAIYNLDSEVESVAEIELDIKEGMEKRDHENNIARALTWLLFRQWPGYETHTTGRIDNMVLHGLGTHVWPRMDQGEWIPRTTRPGTVLFPDDCPIDLHEDGEFFMVRDFWTQNYIYDRIKDEEAATEEGWNVDVVWKTMSETSKRITANITSDPMYWQRLHKQGDVGYTTSRRAGLWINMMFVREFEKDDSYSLYIVQERQTTRDYLFKKRFKFDRAPIRIFPYDNGNGTLQSVRGIGARTKEFFETDNRVRNAALDSLLFAATMPMRQTGDFDPDKLRLLKLGVMSILPQGIEPVSGIQFQDVSKGLTELSGELRDSLTQNNQNYMGGDVESKDRQTYMEYSMRSQDANRAPKATHNLYYRNLGGYYRDIVDMLKIAPEGTTRAARLTHAFYARLESLGTPRQMLKKIVDVRAVRNIGAGSAAARLQAIMMGLQNIYPNTTDDRKINMLRDLAATLFGFQNVDRYAPSLNDGNTVTADESFATLESDVLVQGGEAKVGDRQDHVRHLTIHLAKGDEVNAAYLNQQMEAQPAFTALMALGNHSADHLQALEKLESRQPEFRALYQHWKALSNSLKRMENEIQANQSQTPPQQQLSEDAQVQMTKVQLDNQVKEKKMLLDEQRKDTRQAATEARLNAQMIQTERRETAKHAQSLLLEDASTASKIRRNNQTP